MVLEVSLPQAYFLRHCFEEPIGLMKAIINVYLQFSAKCFYPAEFKPMILIVMD